MSTPQPPPLVLPCPYCEDGLIWQSRYGGNDPDTWATTCPECGGDGEATVQCYAHNCTAWATHQVNYPGGVREFYCPEHVNED